VKYSAAVPRETPDASERDLGSVLDSVLKTFEDVACSDCGKVWGRRRGEDVARCPDCTTSAANRDRFRSEARYLESDGDRLIDRWLKSAGMTERELTAELVRIPKPLWSALSGKAREVVAAMQAGTETRRAFGISGPAGCGKSFALSALMRGYARATWRRNGPTMGMGAARQRLAWVRWPELVHRLRVTAAAKDGGVEDATRLVERLAKMDWCVLDDLGAERMRGSDYADDWATSLLDLLIDTRYNALRPTWWTTNLEAPAFVSRYGARMFSRLAGDNPVVNVRNVSDLRMGGPTV